MKSILFMATMTLGMGLAQAAPEFVCEHKPNVLYGTTKDIGSTLLKTMTNLPETKGGAATKEIYFIVSMNVTPSVDSPSYQQAVAQSLEACEKIKSSIRLEQPAKFDPNANYVWFDDGGGVHDLPRVEYVIGQEAVPYLKGNNAFNSEKMTISFAYTEGADKNQVDPKQAPVIYPSGPDYF